MFTRLLLAAFLVFQASLAAPAAAQAAKGASIRAASLQRVTPENAILVYVDYMTGLDNLITTVPHPQFRNNVTAFTKFNKIFKMPAVILGEENPYYGTFFPELKENVTHDVRRFERTQISGYTPQFRQWLKTSGRKNVILGGISIDNCTLHTALDLLRDGYNVYVVVDVSGSNSQIAEDVALMRLRDAGAVPVGWLSMLSELGRDFASAYGKDMMGVIQAHWPASTYGTVVDASPDGAGLQLQRK